MAKPEGWGLSGGRMEFPNQPSITVKNLTFDANGRILLVRERYIKSKPLVTDKTFEEALIDMGKLIALLQSKRSPIKWEEINYLLNTVIPKPRRFFGMIHALFIGNKTGDWKIDPALAHDWNQDSERNKIILTSIREELEETGLLIRPEPVVEIPVGKDHKIIICYTTEIISGKLKKEGQEIHETEWYSLGYLPPTPEEDENLPRPETMYWKHKNIYIPKTLVALRQRGFTLPCPAEEVDAFLASRPKQQKQTGGLNVSLR